MERRIAPGLRTDWHTAALVGFPSGGDPPEVSALDVRFGQRPGLPRMPQKRALVRSGRWQGLDRDAIPVPSTRVWVCGSIATSSTGNAGNAGGETEPALPPASAVTW